MNLPTLVILSSSEVAGCGLPSFSASSFILLNLCILNTLPSYVHLSCIKNTEPPSSNFIHIAVIRNTGDNIISPNVEPTISIVLLTNACPVVIPTFLARNNGESNRLISSEPLTSISCILGV